MPQIPKVTQHATSTHDTMDAHAAMSSFVLHCPPGCTPTSQGQGGNPAMRNFGADQAPHDEEAAAHDKQKAATT